MSLQYPHPLSPEPDRHLPTNPRRRQHAIQPPSLQTTTLGNVHSFGLGIGVTGQTPVSTTSLSSPFSVHHSSPYPASPGALLRGTSPMALRNPAGFNAPYNPQQWRLSSNASPSPASASTVASRQPSQSTRVVVSTAQPMGPDGMPNSAWKTKK